MSENVISLVPKIKEVGLEVNQDLVELLEGLVKLANEGKLIAGAFVCETNDDSTYTVWSPNITYHTTIAGLRILEHKIIKDCMEPRPSSSPRTS